MINSFAVTLYNCRLSSNPPYKPAYRRTVIKGCHWENSTYRDTGSNGQVFFNKATTIIIPKDADSEGRKYADPREYANLPADDESRWTLNIDQSNPDIIVLSECDKEIGEGYTVTQLKKDFTAVDVKAVSDATQSAVQPHIEVTGV